MAYTFGFMRKVYAYYVLAEGSKAYFKNRIL